MSSGAVHGLSDNSLRSVYLGTFIEQRRAIMEKEALCKRKRSFDMLSGFKNYIKSTKKN